MGYRLCPTTGKERLAKRTAKRRIKSIERKDRERGRPHVPRDEPSNAMTSWVCQFCGDWHVGHRMAGGV